MASFDFITNEAFRKSLENDFVELAACANAKAWKAVHVLSGSIIEAVLIDHLNESGRPLRQDPLKMEFAELIQLCKEEKLLSDKAVGLSIALKGYRNLIHPGRALRLGEIADANGAKVAQALVEIIVEEVAARRRESYGYTADQIVGKICQDPSATSIIEHLLKRLHPHETERLLLKTLPDSYMELLSVDTDNIETLNHLANCFRLALDSATEEMNRKVALKYVSVLQEEGKHKVEIYELMFFRATDFKYLDVPSRAVIKAHLIASMRKKLSLPLINVCEGIGAYLDDANEVESFLGALLPPILSQNDGLCAAAIERLYYEKQNMSAERKNGLDARIAKLKSLYGNAKRDLFVKALDELELVLLDVPF